ncbi:hypothetical protein D9M69_520080 [compost metagenome]
MCQTAHISKWLNCTSTQIEQRSGISLGANLGFSFPGVEQLHIGAATCPLLIAIFKFLETVLANGTMQRSLLFNFASNLVFFDQFKNQLRRITENVEQTVAVLLAQNTRQIVRHDPHARIDQTNITARTAIADFDTFQHDCFRALFREMQRSGKPGETTTNNHHIGSQIAFKSSCFWCSWSGLFPKAMRAWIVEHERQPFHRMKNRRLLPPKLFHALEVSMTAIFMQQFMPVGNELTL